MLCNISKTQPREGTHLQGRCGESLQDLEQPPHPSVPNSATRQLQLLHMTSEFQLILM